MLNWLQGSVTEHHPWTPTLFTLRVGNLTDATGEPVPEFPFQPGQFVRIGVKRDGEIVHRAYSLVCSPGANHLEFVITAVPSGVLSPTLNQLQPGDPIYVAQTPGGFFSLKEIPNADSLWMLATGTGIGPYLSMLSGAEPWQRFQRVILVHAVRHANELCYANLIKSWQQTYGSQFHYQPIVSREDHSNALRGRIPGLLQSGQLEATASTQIDSTAQIMLCGNPDMIKDTRQLLQERDLHLNLRRKPGNVTLEQYWKS